MTDIATNPAAVERDVGGCPVMHRDFAPEQAAGCHWELADELREASPVYFNTFAQGYWVFTRHDAVRDIYKTPELFSSESITPWQPEPIYRFVPTQIDAPDHIKYRRIVNPWFSPRAMDAAEASMRTLCRRLVEEVAPTGGCDFVTEFALRFPTEAFLSVSGIDSVRRRPVRPVGRGLLQRLRRRPGRPGSDGEGARRDPRVLGRRARGASSRPGAARGRPRLASAPLELRRPSAHRRRDARHADRARARRTRHDARHARLHVPPPRDAPRAPPAPDRRAGADPVRGRGGPALLHDHLRRRPQGDPRHRVPRRAAQAGRHGLRARLGRQPRSARVRAGRRVRHRSKAQQPHGLRERSAPLPGRSTWHGASCSSPSRSGCA